MNNMSLYRYIDDMLRDICFENDVARDNLLRQIVRTNRYITQEHMDKYKKWKEENKE